MRCPTCGVRGFDVWMRANHADLAPAIAQRMREQHKAGRCPIYKAEDDYIQPLWMHGEACNCARCYERPKAV